MSLNDTGKFIDSIKRIGGIDKSLDITSQAKAIILMMFLESYNYLGFQRNLGVLY